MLPASPFCGPNLVSRKVPNGTRRDLYRTARPSASKSCFLDAGSGRQPRSHIQGARIDGTEPPRPVTDPRRVSQHEQQQGFVLRQLHDPDRRRRRVRDSGAILDDWSSQYGFTKGELGTITGGGLTGFGVVILLASLITDKLGYKPIMILAFVLHVLSAAMTLSAGAVYAASGKDATFSVLFYGMFLFSVANGLCEAVINPLVATLYPKQKTHYLNILHAGGRGGLIIGALLAKRSSERWRGKSRWRCSSCQR